MGETNKLIACLESQVNLIQWH